MNIHGKSHYTIMAGAIIRVPIFADGDEVGHHLVKTECDICVYVEESTVQTTLVSSFPS
jgi:hypothetical protein